MFRDVPTHLGCIWNCRPYGGMLLECLQVDSELILCQDPINGSRCIEGACRLDYASMGLMNESRHSPRECEVNGGDRTHDSHQHGGHC
jgi:hypothetical protein